jgi:carboxypeptidase T
MLGAVAMPRYRITISGPDEAAMTDLVREHGIRVFDHGIGFAPDTGYSVDALAAPDEIRKLQQHGYVVVQHEDADELGQIRQREVGQGNRYTLATHASSEKYLNVEEVEAAILAAAAPPFSGFAELITLPHLSCEGRQCHALKIGSGSGAGRIGVYFLGGVHGSEWGSCDILINFIERIEQAYLNNTGLTFDAKTFSAAEIKTIVDTLDIVIFPQANPDGRNYSMNCDSNWRKNRGPPLNGCRGVDINRNYDFLWDFRKLFWSQATIADSADPCDNMYCGQSAFSEPETQNARWIVDKFTNTRFFIDVHAYGRDILYCWGDGRDQTDKPEMNFMNGYYDSLRGDNKSYQEYIPCEDLAAAKSLAHATSAGIKAVAGIVYSVRQANFLYATCASSSDYFYSRHFTDASQAKIVSYTLEWGTEPQPPYRDMRQIIKEVTAGLLAFCLEIVARTQRPA